MMIIMMIIVAVIVVMSSLMVMVVCNVPISGTYPTHVGLDAVMFL